MIEALCMLRDGSTELVEELGRCVFVAYAMEQRAREQTAEVLTACMILVPLPRKSRCCIENVADAILGTYRVQRKVLVGVSSEKFWANVCLTSEQASKRRLSHCVLRAEGGSQGNSQCSLPACQQRKVGLISLTMRCDSCAAETEEDSHQNARERSHLSEGCKVLVLHSEVSVAK